MIISTLKKRRFDLLLAVLVASWPVARFLEKNVGKLYSHLDLLIVFIGCLASTLIVSLFKKKNLFISFLLFFVLFFGFKDFCLSLEAAFPATVDIYHSYGGKIAYLWFACVAALLTLTRFSPTFAAFIPPFLLVFTFVKWVEVLPLLFKGTADTRDIAFNGLVLKHKPNIYFLMIDAYPGERTSREFLGNTGGLAPLLRKKGFYVPTDSRSNYHFTLASLSSQLQMSYHKPKEKLFSGIDFFAYPIAGRNNLVRVLKNNGYDFAFAPSGRVSEMSCRGFEDICLSHTRWDMDLLRIFQQSTPFVYLPLIQGRYLEPHDIQEFVRARSSKSPLFLFAHFLQVHDAVSTKAGRTAQQPRICICNGLHVSQFKDAQKTFDSQLIQLVSYIRREDPEAIIVINSDHGPAIKLNPRMSPEENFQRLVDWYNISGKDLQDRLNNLIAIYLPEPYRTKGLTTDYLKNNMSNVNIFRGILSVLCDIDLPPLKNKAFVIMEHEDTGLYSIRQEHVESIGYDR